MSLEEMRQDTIKRLDEIEDWMNTNSDELQAKFKYSPRYEKLSNIELSLVYERRNLNQNLFLLNNAINEARA